MVKLMDKFLKFLNVCVYLYYVILICLFFLLMFLVIVLCYYWLNKLYYCVKYYLGLSEG